jgi:hypothetical protein
VEQVLQQQLELLVGMLYGTLCLSMMCSNASLTSMSWFRIIVGCCRSFAPAAAACCQIILPAAKSCCLLPNHELQVQLLLALAPLTCS